MSAGQISEWLAAVHGDTSWQCPRGVAVSEDCSRGVPGWSYGFPPFSWAEDWVDENGIHIKVNLEGL